MTEEIYSKYLACGGRVTTDSRTISGGEIFIALKGENFDGNAYALQALEKGAAWAVVDDCPSDDPRLIHVPDSLEALRQLSLAHREALRGSTTFIGLTGTNGKTTTKELIRAVLATTWRVSATKGNLNNDIGVPLTLLSIPSDCDMAIVEMGANHPDDISHLTEIVRPDWGLITNVGKAHLLGFGSFEGVKKAKGQLYDAILSGGKAVFVNADDPHLTAMAREREGLSIIPYGILYQDVTVLPSSPEEPFLRLKVSGRTISTRLVGAYNANNVLAALCIGAHFEVPFEDAVAAVEAYEPSNSRSQMMRAGSNSLIVDAYNANPSSMSAALDNFSSLEGASRLALLGDMRELGEDSLREHVAIVNKVAGGGYDAIFVGEEFKRALAASEGASYRWFATSDDLADWLRTAGIENTALLIKGSRGIRMEKAVEALSAPVSL